MICLQPALDKLVTSSKTKGKASLKKLTLMEEIWTILGQLCDLLKVSLTI